MMGEGEGEGRFACGGKGCEKGVRKGGMGEEGGSSKLRVWGWSCDFLVA